LNPLVKHERSRNMSIVSAWQLPSIIAELSVNQSSRHRK
jgi:hypothetical protein